MRDRRRTEATNRVPASASTRFGLVPGRPVHPAMSRPMELYVMLRALDPKLFYSKHLFGMRYCEGTFNGFGYEYRGATHIDELHTLLNDKYMIRRLKDDVLSIA